MRLIFLAALLGAPGGGDAVAAARTFLGALASDPQSTKQLVTDDALFAVGDIGGSYADLLKASVGRESILKGFFARCVQRSIEQKPTPPDAELRSFPAPSFRTKGSFALVVSSYACRRDDGSTGATDVMIYFKDDRVALFGFDPRR